MRGCDDWVDVCCLLLFCWIVADTSQLRSYRLPCSHYIEQKLLASVNQVSKKEQIEIYLSRSSESSHAPFRREAINNASMRRCLLMSRQRGSCRMTRQGPLGHHGGQSGRGDHPAPARQPEPAADVCIASVQALRSGSDVDEAPRRRWRRLPVDAAAQRASAGPSPPRIA